MGQRQPAARRLPPRSLGKSCLSFVLQACELSPQWPRCPAEGHAAVQRSGGRAPATQLMVPLVPSRRLTSGYLIHVRGRPSFWSLILDCPGQRPRHDSQPRVPEHGPRCSVPRCPSSSPAGLGLMCSPGPPPGNPCPLRPRHGPAETYVTSQGREPAALAPSESSGPAPPLCSGGSHSPPAPGSQCVTRTEEVENSPAPPPGAARCIRQRATSQRGSALGKGGCSLKSPVRDADWRMLPTFPLQAAGFAVAQQGRGGRGRIRHLWLNASAWMPPEPLSSSPVTAATWRCPNPRGWGARCFWGPGSRGELGVREC